MKIFPKYECKILKRKERYLAQYNSGGSASWLLENEITQEECDRAQCLERDVYEVILDASQKIRTMANRLSLESSDSAELSIKIPSPKKSADSQHTY